MASWTSVAHRALESEARPGSLTAAPPPASEPIFYLRVALDLAEARHLLVLPLTALLALPEPNPQLHHHFLVLGASRPVRRRIVRRTPASTHYNKTKVQQRKAIS